VIFAGRALSIAALNETTGEGITDYAEHIPFSKAHSAALDLHETAVTLTNTGKALTVKWCELVISGEEGELLRIPVQNDMDASSIVEDFNRRCSASV
jgi:hypothetical protein